jgi:hypothetical protein
MMGRFPMQQEDERAWRDEAATQAWIAKASAKRAAEREKARNRARKKKAEAEAQAQARKSAEPTAR